MSKRVRVMRLVTYGVTAAMFASHPAQAQSLTISATPQCPACTLRFEQAFDLGASSGPAMLESDNVGVVRDARGRFYVTPTFGTSILVFDSSGRFVRSVGRKGGGPAEFEGIAAVRFTRGDTMRVFDRSLSRQVVFGPNYEFVRATTLDVPVTLRVASFADGRSVVNTVVRTPERIGFPLHLIDGVGRITHSFGSETGVFRRDVPGLLDRAIALAGPTTVWAAHARVYQIELIDVNTGRVLRRLARGPKWFPNGELPRLGPPLPTEDPPETHLVSVHQDAQGLLWLGFTVADVRWKSVVAVGEPGHIKISDPTKYTDAIVEVVDPRTGALVASIRYDTPPGAVIGDGLRARVVTNGDGAPVVRIFRVKLLYP